MNRLPVLIRATGDWGPEQVRVAWADTARAVVPEVEAVIDAAWRAAAARPGVKLFDGPMCRLESWDVDADNGILHLRLSRTSYKPFVGTNMTHPELADDPRYGPRVMANPVGLSAALVTADGWLVLGRRNATVAYYPGRVHPFAGALEPGDPLPDVFAEVRRELREELGFGDAAVADVRLAGIVEDVSLRQPELIFSVRTPRARSHVEAGLHDDEHHAVFPVALRAGEMSEVLGDPVLTPVAVGAVLLTGRAVLGDAWFAAHAPRSP